VVLSRQVGASTRVALASESTVESARARDGTTIAMTSALAMTTLPFASCLSANASLALAAFAVLASASACTPATKYRYTGLVPAAHALAWDGRTAKDGTLRLEGSMAQSTVHRNIAPVKGDTALRVPNTTLEGAAFLAAIPNVEFGVRYSYSAYAWSEPSAEGTMSLPSHPSVWGIGPELRGAIPFDKRRKFMIGVAANVMRFDVPYAEWEKTPYCALGPTCAFDTFTYPGDAGTYYRLVNEKSEAHLTLSIAVYPSLLLGDEGEYGHVFGGFSVHSAFKNDGFTDKSSNGSTIQDAGLLFMMGAGYGIAFEPFRLAAMLTLPTASTSSPVNYGMGGFFTVGVDLELWESKEARRARERREAAPPRESTPSPPREAPTPPGVYVIPGPP
jgi:hypothetical protein